MYTEERDVLEDMSKIDECDIEKCGKLNGEKTIAILGDRWWPQYDETGRGYEDKLKFYVYGMTKNVMSAQALEVSLIEVQTVLRLEWDA